MSSKNRLLYAIPSLGGGGAERQLSYLAGQLSQRGWEVHVAFLTGGPNLPRLEASGVGLHHLRSRGHYDPRILSELRRTICHIQPGLIQTWMPMMDILGGMAARLARVPVILSERNSALAYRGDWREIPRVVLGRGAAAIIANSDAGKDYWVPKVRARVPVRVIRNAIPFEEIKAAELTDVESGDIGPGKELVIFAGRYTAQKNVINLLGALRETLTGRPTAQAILFGDGPLRDELLALRNAYGLGNRISILGFTNNLWGWLKHADVFVSVSHFEGNPNTVLEATACRCPVVVSDIPEHREFLDENSAYFVPPSSPEAIAAGIMRALAAREEALSKSGRAYEGIAAFSLASVTQEYIREYLAVLSREPAVVAATSAG